MFSSQNNEFSKNSRKSLALASQTVTVQQLIKFIARVLTFPFTKPTKLASVSPSVTQKEMDFEVFQDPFDSMVL